MSNLAIRVDRLGKQYRVGTTAVRHDTLREAVTDAVRAPFRSLARLKRLTKFQPGETDMIWALRDVSFTIPQGQAVGVIGHNGAGKSTLLKILSRITKPSTGAFSLRGRVGSLLEVGTGFHAELSGRENVYLNGSILGMDRAYIDRRFDEIVEFAGVEKYIDTPVKRFSSGMYLRLAFAVAAHLEPEILMVDEVLAVGDLEFQKRCIGKMGEVTNDGRTVLFVSHNVQAISQLTTRCLFMSGGECQFDGPTTDAVQLYVNSQLGNAHGAAVYAAPDTARCNRVAAASVRTSDPDGIHHWGEPVSFEFEIDIPHPSNGLCFSFQVVNEQQAPVCHFWLLEPDVPYRCEPGRYRLCLDIPCFRLYMGAYTVTTWLTDRRSNEIIERLTYICPFRVAMHGIERGEYEWSPGACAYLEDGTWNDVERVRAG